MVASAGVAMMMTLLGLAFWPVVALLSPRGAVALWPLARIMGLVMTGIIAMVCAMMADDGAVWRISWGEIALAALPFWLWLGHDIYRNRKSWMARLKRGWWLAVAGEAVFWLGVLGYGFLLSFNPDLDPGSERFVGASLLGLYSAFPQWPPMDPWMAGLPANYYHFGYWMLATPMRLAGDALDTGFLPILICTWALSAQALAGLALWLTRKLWSAGLAVFMVLLAGNPDSFLRPFIEEGGIQRYNWFAPARVINDKADLSAWSIPGEVITEFPMFSVIYGDLHPYVVALPFTVAALWLLALALRANTGRLKASTRLLRLPARHVLALGGTIAILAATHMWNALFFGGLLAGLFGLLLTRRVLQPRNAPSRIPQPAEIGDWLLVAAFGWAFTTLLLGGFDQSGRDLGRVQVTSDAQEMLRLLGWHLGLALIWLGICWRLGWLDAALKWARGKGLALMIPLAVLMAIISFNLGGGAFVLLASMLVLFPMIMTTLAGRMPPRILFALSLIIASLAASFLLEIVFVDDMFGGELERMNTVFKIHFLVWLSLGVAGAVLMADIPILRMARQHKLSLGAAAACLLAILGGMSVYPYAATRAATYHFAEDRQGWNTDRAIARYLPSDKAALDWLRAQRDAPLTLLEASHDASRTQPSFGYHWYGRMASLSGHPGYIAWPHHEGGWRQHDDRIWQRVDNVQRLYMPESSDALLQGLHKAGIDIVVIGPLERRAFGTALPLEMFRKTLDPVFEDGETLLLRVPDTISKAAEQPHK